MFLVGLAAALVMGLVLGVVGGGGSILTVPILVYLFGLDPVLATAYSLVIVGFTALIGGISYYKKGEVNLKVGFLFAAPSFLGVYLVRKFVMPAIPAEISLTEQLLIAKPTLIMLVFAIIMVLAAFSMLRHKKPNQQKASSLSPQLRSLLIIGEGILVGGVTGFVGAGGGFLIIPALVLLVGLPMKQAVGTSLLIIAVKSIFGFAGDLQNGIAIDYTLLLQVTALAIAGLLVGVKLSRHVPEEKLKKGFGIFVLVMGAVILWDNLN